MEDWMSLFMAKISISSLKSSTEGAQQSRTDKPTLIWRKLGLSCDFNHT
jgi:hypothetical protein